MKGLWLQDQILSYREDLPLPKPSQDEVLIKVISAGICATDLELVKGYYPFKGIPGHEFIGVVESSPFDPTWQGRRVVGEINITCGNCPYCHLGDRNHCENRKVCGIKDHNGAFTEYLTLPIANLHHVPDEITDDAGVFTEPLAAALEILDQVDINPDDHVLVIGAGRFGQLIAQVFNSIPCNLVVVAKYPHQRRLLTNLGIRILEQADVPKTQYDFVVEVTGSPKGLSYAIDGVRPRGTIVLKSTFADTVDINISRIVVNEITMVGSRCGPFEPALKLLKNKSIDPLPLISTRFSIQNGLRAFETAVSSDVFKVLIHFE